MQIILYKNISESNKIGKTLVDGTAILGDLKDETSVTNPVILIESDNPTQFNYAHIPIFGRYYFITDIVCVRSNLWRITLRVDVLESFKSEILQAPAIIHNSTVIGADPYMTGDVWISKVKENTNIINFPYGLPETGEFILITAGG